MNYIAVYPESAVLYVCLVVFAGLFAYLADKHNSTFCLVVLIVVVSVFSGLRDNSVGIDTMLSYNTYNNTLLYGAADVSTWNSSIIPYAMEVISGFAGYWMYTFLISALLYPFLIMGFWGFRKQVSFTACIVIFMMLYYQLTLNIERQFLGIAIMFWGTRYFFDGKYFRYLLCVGVACAIHRSCLVGLVLFSFLPLYSSAMTFNKRTLLTLFEVAFPVVLCVAIFYGFNLYSDYYLSDLSLDLGLIGFVKLLFVCIIAGIILSTRKNLGAEEKIICVLAVVGAVVAVSVYFVGFASRIGLLFEMFEVLLFAYVLKNGTKNECQLSLLLLAIICTYVFLGDLSNNGQGVMPYSAHSIIDIFRG